MQAVVKLELVTEKVNCGAVGFLLLITGCADHWNSTAEFRIMFNQAGGGVPGFFTARPRV